MKHDLIFDSDFENIIDDFTRKSFFSKMHGGEEANFLCPSHQHRHHHYLHLEAIFHIYIFMMCSRKLAKRQCEILRENLRYTIIEACIVCNWISFYSSLASLVYTEEPSKHIEIRFKDFESETKTKA